MFCYAISHDTAFAEAFDELVPERSLFRIEFRKARKGTNGARTNGVTAFSFFLTVFLLGTPVNLRLSSQKCQGVAFSPISQIHYFCCDPISVDPICPRPKGGGEHADELTFNLTTTTTTTTTT